jgi:hypothetical protein
MNATMFGLSVEETSIGTLLPVVVWSDVVCVVSVEFGVLLAPISILGKFSSLQTMRFDLFEPAVAFFELWLEFRNTLFPVVEFEEGPSALGK